MKRQLENMVVLITGASAGLGCELARQLSARGARLALAARRLDRLEALNRELGGRHLCIRTDVGIPEQCAILAQQTLEHFGRIDTLVCNAGYGQIGRTAEASPAEVRRIFNTNVFGTTDLIHAALPVMLQQEPTGGWRGQIVIVSSAAAGRGLPYFGPYSATKAAQKSLAEALRVELRPRRIAVTSIHPIGTETDFFNTAESGSDVKIQTPQRKAFRQKAQVVVQKIVRAIERPRPEVWPFPPVKLGLMLSFLFPRLGDYVMTRVRRQIEQLNRIE